MCGTSYPSYSNQSQAQANCAPVDRRPPEAILSEIFKNDLGVTINEQAFRIFLRTRWDRVSKLAHRIHDGA